MAQVLGPSPTGPRTDHVVIATPDFSDTATITASASPINGTALTDLVTRQPADLVEFTPLSETLSGITLQFLQNTPTRWDVVFALANATPEAQWEVRAGDSAGEAAGTTAYDSSGNANHGTIAGGPVFEAGKYGGALVLDDTDTQYVETDPLTLTGNDTMMGWFRPDGLGGEQVVFAHDQDSLGIAARLMPDGRVQIGPGPTAIGTTVLVPGYWYHIAVVFAAVDTVRLYIDGDLEIEVTGEVVSTVGAGVLRWGQSPNPEPDDVGFIGAMDDLRFYAAAHTDAEIQAAMASETPPDATNLVAHYKLNGYHSGVRTFGMPPNLATRTRRGAFLLTPYAMTNRVVQIIITDPDNTTDFRVHRVVVGTGWQPERNFDFGEGIGFDDDSKATRTPTSQTMIVRRVPVPVLEFVVRHLSRRDMLAHAYEIARAQGTSGEVVVCLNPNDEEFQEAVTLYGRMAEIGRLTEPHHDLWETTYRVEGFL